MGLREMIRSLNAWERRGMGTNGVRDGVKGGGAGHGGGKRRPSVQEHLQHLERAGCPSLRHPGAGTDGVDAGGGIVDDGC